MFDDLKNCFDFYLRNKFRFSRKNFMEKNKDLIKRNEAENLYTKDIPDPDILIRTSGEQRISNYLLWQIAYTELFFTNTLWPDFGKEELLSIIEQFNNRERRYGKN